jgi:LmbE family N-acetylglucosaminyl deacetylase
MIQGKVIFISPHPDDIEFYCGGTLVKLIEQGCDVHVYAFSDCKESLPKGFDTDALAREYLDAMDVAGVYKRGLHRIPVRRFSEVRQEILERLVLLNERIEPDFVFIPSGNDLHQDHQVMHYESRRAFKSCSVLSYEVPLNSLQSDFNYIVSLEQHHVDKKLEIISQYKSQAHRHYSDPDYIVSLLRYKGAYIRKQYAETFKIIKWID